MFIEQFKSLENLVKQKLFLAGEPFSQFRAANLLGTTIGKYQAWSKGQYPCVEDMKHLINTFSFNARWILLGEGPVFKTENNITQEIESVTFSRFNKFRAHMRYYDLQWKDICNLLGLSMNATILACQREKIRPEYRIILLEQGFPPDVLPEPNPRAYKKRNTPLADAHSILS